MSITGKFLFGSPKYAALVLGVTHGLIPPMDAARQILTDLQASGVDVAGALATMRNVFAGSAKMLEAIEAIAAETAPKGPKRETIAYREVKP